MYVVLILAVAVLVAVILMLAGRRILHRQAIETFMLFTLIITFKCGAVCKTQDHYFS